MSVWKSKCPLCKRIMYTAPCYFCGDNNYNKSILNQALVCNVCGRSFVKGLECPNDGYKIAWWKLSRRGIIKPGGCFLIILVIFIISIISSFLKSC